MRICSGWLPERERIPHFREFFARKILRIDIEPLAGHPLEADLTLDQLPGLGILSSKNTPVTIARRSTDASDEGFVLQLAKSTILHQQLGRDAEFHAGEASALLSDEPGTVVFPEAGGFVSLLLPRKALGSLLGDVENCVARPVQQTSTALRLLRGYLSVVKQQQTSGDRELQALVVNHIYDLVALALGATRDTAEQAKGRGVRAARLHAIKKDVAAHLEEEISLDRIAARHGVSPRYVRMLFEDEGTSFTEFVREQRLLLARRMLLSRRFDHRRIGDIAYESGFNDLSYFNRMFRRRFGRSPGEVRHGFADA